MARIGSASGSGPSFEISLRDQDFKRILAAAKPHERNSKLVLSPELKIRVIAIVRNYARDRRAGKNEPRWRDVEDSLKPLAKALRQLSRALNDLSRRHKDDPRRDHASTMAKRLLQAHLPPHHKDLGAFETATYSLTLGAQRATGDCKEHGGKPGAERDAALDVCLCEMKAIYKAAGGTSIEPTNATYDGVEDVVATKISGFVAFTHECLACLPIDIYPYQDKDPENLTALAQIVRRPAKTRSPTIIDVIAVAESRRNQD